MIKIFMIRTLLEKVLMIKNYWKNTTDKNTNNWNATDKNIHNKNNNSKRIYNNIIIIINSYDISNFWWYF